MPPYCIEYLAFLKKKEDLFWRNSAFVVQKKNQTGQNFFTFSLHYCISLHLYFELHLHFEFATEFHFELIRVGQERQK